MLANSGRGIKFIHQLCCLCVGPGEHRLLTFRIVPGDNRKPLLSVANMWKLVCEKEVEDFAQRVASVRTANADPIPELRAKLAFELCIPEGEPLQRLLRLVARELVRRLRAEQTQPKGPATDRRYR